jgi:hypothetical protein
MFPGFWGRFVHGDQMTVAFWRVKAGSSVPLHHHVNEQIMHILEGRFEFTLDGKTQICEPGAVVVILPIRCIPVLLLPIVRSSMFSILFGKITGCEN